MGIKETNAAVSYIHGGRVQHALGTVWQYDVGQSFADVFHAIAVEARSVRHVF